MERIEKCDFTPILLRTQRVVIIGLSPDKNRDSNLVGRYLQDTGFKITSVYPKGELILGQRVYQSVIEALEIEQPDILVVFRKSEAIPQIAAEVLRSNFLPKLFWMQLGIANLQAKSMLEAKRMIVVEDKCIKIEHEKIIGLSKERRE